MTSCGKPSDAPKSESRASTSRDSFEWDGTKITQFIGKETEVVIPKGVTEINLRAFEGCSSLTSVVIPESVTKIGEDAFYGCPKLTIHAPAGSAAEEYAQMNNISFEAK